MSEDQRFLVLLVTQLICTIVVLWIARDFLPKKVYKLIGWIALFTIPPLLLSKPAVNLFIRCPKGICIHYTIGIVYLLDLVALFVIIHNTGGLSQSPFSPLLILLPTNSIILNEHPYTVLVYYLGTVLPALWLVSHSPEITLNPDQRRDYKEAVRIIYLFILLSSFVGYSLPFIVKI